MGETDFLIDKEYSVGDIVRELTIIVPPERNPWYGIVVDVETAPDEWSSWLDPDEELVSVHWFQTDTIEHLPGCVLEIIQKAKRKA